MNAGLLLLVLCLAVLVSGKINGGTREVVYNVSTNIRMPKFNSASINFQPSFSSPFVRDFTTKPVHKEPEKPVVEEKPVNKILSAKEQYREWVDNNKRIEDLDKKLKAAKERQRIEDERKTNVLPFPNITRVS